MYASCHAESTLASPKASSHIQMDKACSSASRQQAHLERPIYGLVAVAEVSTVWPSMLLVATVAAGAMATAMAMGAGVVASTGAGGMMGVLTSTGAAAGMGALMTAGAGAAAGHLSAGSAITSQNQKRGHHDQPL